MSLRSESTAKRGHQSRIARIGGTPFGGATAGCARRASGEAETGGYCRQPVAASVQVQLWVGVTTVGASFGTTATKPRSLVSPGPGNTSEAAAAIEVPPP